MLLITPAPPDRLGRTENRRPKTGNSPQATGELLRQIATSKIKDT